MRQHGFTLVELAVVVICVGAVSGLVLDRVLPLVRLAERTAFEQVKGQLSSALRLAAAERVARGESASLAAFEGSNPMALLQHPPVNYVGSFDGAVHDAMPRRSWYFDAGDRALYYRAGLGASLVVADREAERIALRVRFAFRDRDDDGAFDPARDAFDGIALDPVADYVWGDD